MDEVNLNRLDVLKVMRTNRDKHRKIFEDALEGWHKAVIEALERATKEALAGKKFRTQFSLPEPQDHTADYDKEIKMLEMSVDDVIELSRYQFEQYVLDDWGWKPDFLATSNTYNSYNKPSKRKK